MANIIDTLVVELALDPTKFTQGQKDAIEAAKKTTEQLTSAGKQIEAQGKKVSEFFTTLKRETIGFIGLAFGGNEARKFLDYIVDLDTSNLRLARTMDVSTRTLASWQGAAEQVGGTAQDITATFQSVTSELQRFQFTGQSTLVSMLRPLGMNVFDANHHLKTTDVILKELANNPIFLKMDARGRAGFLGLLGFNQSTIQLLIQGGDALNKALAASSALLGPLDEAAELSIKFQKSLALTEQAAIGLGQALGVNVLPPLTELLNTLRSGATGGQSLWDYLTTLPSFSIAAGSPMDKLMGGLRNGPAQMEHEMYIRKAAAARGIDPDQAIRVARSEGLGGPGYAGDNGSSFGDFQLHYGGIAPGMMHPGLGDAFTKATGLNARDPSTWKAQADFALDQAAKGGWGPWRGWTGSPNAGIGARAAAAARSPVSNRGGDTSTSTTSVGTVVVNAPGADSTEIAANIKGALIRASKASQANYGQQ